MYFLKGRVVTDRLPKIGFSGTRNQPKNGFLKGKLNNLSFCSDISQILKKYLELKLQYCERKKNFNGKMGLRQVENLFLHTYVHTG